jgi:hypothetical protein
MDDELLRGLGRHQREDLETTPDDSSDEPWAELLEPFDDATREQMLDAVFEQVDTQAERVEPVVPSPPANEPEREREQVIDLASRRRGVVLGLLVAAAAAVTLGIWWNQASSPDRSRTVAMLPEYETSELRGGPASHRSAPDSELESVTMGARDELEWVVSPIGPVSGPIGLALLAEPESGQPILVPEVGAEITESGAVRLQGPLDGFVELAPGSWTLTLFIAPPDQLPTDVEQARASEGAGWQRVSVRVTIAD